MMNPTSARQRGYGLVELMLTLTLGMIVIGGALAIYMSTFGANASALKIARLNNELRGIMTFVARDLKRSGYWETAGTHAATNTLATTNPNPFNVITLDTVADSIEFRYDWDQDGAVDANETFGFRYDSAEKAVEMRQSTSWSNLSDPSVIEVTAFEISENSPASVTLGTTTVQLRQFTIQITGRLKSDTSVQRTLRETVRLRNERLS